MTSELHDTVSARLRGVRYTDARQLLIEVLATSGRPITAEELSSASPDLPLSTVYRNLAMFEEAGVVQKLAGNGEHAKYELSEPFMSHHHHLSCSSCGAMIDVLLPRRFEAQLDRQMAAIADDYGFELTAHNLDLVGRCGACIQGAAAAASG